MNKERNRSLRWSLMKRLFVLQAFLLVLFVVLLVGWIWIINPELEDANEEAVRVVAESVMKDGQGRVQLLETPEFTQLKQQYPDLWFIVRNDQEIVLQYGKIPWTGLDAAFPWTINRARVQTANTTRATVENRNTSARLCTLSSEAKRLGHTFDAPWRYFRCVPVKRGLSINILLP